MKYWALFFSILIAGPVFAACEIGQQQFGVSSRTIEDKLEGPKILEPIPDVQKQIITIFEDVCPKLEDVLAMDTSLHYHFIKDQLIAIQLERAEYDDLLLFEWARQYFGIAEELKIDEAEQFMQVEEDGRAIQLYLGILPNAVYQSVMIISKEHDDLFEWLAEKEDAIDWENYEDPDSESSEEEN